MTQDDVKMRVRCEVVQHLNDAVKLGPEYLDSYVESALCGQPWYRGSGGMHPGVARMIRDVALDVLAETRGTVEA